MIYFWFFDSRVLTAGKSNAECSKFSAAEQGTVWDQIFKKNMKLEESCIGLEAGKKQMEESDKLFTTFYFSYDDEPCTGAFFKENHLIQN